MITHTFPKAVLAWAFVLTVPLMPQLAQSATLSLSAAAPTVDGADIANLDMTNAKGQGKFWNNEAFAAGQTFTTGANAGGYQLNSTSIQFFGTYDPNNGNTDYEPTKTYVVRLVTKSGNALSEIHSETATQTVIAKQGDFLTFSFDTPQTLAANTEYGFDVHMSASTTGWRTGIPTVTYSDGTTAGSAGYLASSWTDGDKNNWTAADLATVSDRNQSWVFHVDLDEISIAAIPEPSSAVLAASGLVLLMGMRRRRRP